MKTISIPLVGDKKSYFSLQNVMMAAPFFLAAITCISYAPSLIYGFVFDDLYNILKYYDIRHTSFFTIFLKSSRWISYWLNSLYYKISGFNPVLYRCGNLIFHIITGILIFYVIKALFEHAHKKYAFEYAFLTAGLFLLHPVQTQTVSYIIQGQLEGLSALFMMLTIWFFIQWADAHGTKKIVYLCALFASAFLACGAKEISIVLPVLLCMCDWFFISRPLDAAFFDKLRMSERPAHPERSRRVIHAAIFFLVITMYLYFLKPAYFASIFGLKTAISNNIGNILTEHADQAITPYLFCISQFKVILHYISIFFWPFTMSADYDWVLVENFFALECLAPFALLVLLAGYILYRLIKNPTDIFSFCCLWFFILVLPRASIIPSTELIADYKTYLASLGIFLGMSMIIVRVLHLFNMLEPSTPLTLSLSKGHSACPSKPWRSRELVEECSVNKLFLILSAAFFLCLGYSTSVRNTIWSSSQAFWWDVIQKSPSKARAYNNYANALAEQQKFEDALPFYEKALMLDRKYVDAWNNRAIAYSALGNYDAAIMTIKECIALRPNYPEAYNNLASFLMGKQQWEQALVIVNRAIELRPYYGKAFFNKGKIYLELNRQEDAWIAFKNCCMNADFDNEMGFSAYGMVSSMLKKFDDAIFAYQKVVQLTGGSYQSLFFLANAYYLNHNYAIAREWYEKILGKNPNDIKLLFNYAECLYAQGNFSRALEYYKKVELINPAVQGLSIRIASCKNY